MTSLEALAFLALIRKIANKESDGSGPFLLWQGLIFILHEISPCRVLSREIT